MLYSYRGHVLKRLSDNWTRDGHKVMWLGKITRVWCMYQSICASQFDWLFTLAITWSIRCVYFTCCLTLKLDATTDPGRGSSQVDKLCIHTTNPPPSLPRFSIGPRLPPSSRRLVLHDPHRQHTKSRYQFTQKPASTCS